MIETIEKCLELAKRLESDVHQSSLRTNEIKKREKELSLLNDGLSLKEKDLLEREKRLIPTEKIIKMGFECEEMLRKAQSLKDDSVLVAKNNTAANDVERDRLHGVADGLKRERKSIDDKILEFEEMKKNWKEKAIKELTSSSS